MRVAVLNAPRRLDIADLPVPAAGAPLPRWATTRMREIPLGAWNWMALDIVNAHSATSRRSCAACAPGCAC